MKLLDWLRLRIATLFHRGQINAEMEEELRSHIQHRADDLEGSGMTRAEAERRVHFRGKLEGARELVTADVERAESDLPGRDGFDDGAVDLVLLVLVRLREPIDVEELGAIEADAVGTVIEREDGFGR